jgi:hypothetical protein
MTIEPSHRLSVGSLARAVPRALSLGVIALGVAALLVWPTGASLLALFWILIIFLPVAIWPVPMGSIIGGVIALAVILLVCLSGSFLNTTPAEWRTLLAISAGGLVFAALISGNTYIYSPLLRLFRERPDIQLKVEKQLEDKSRTVQRRNRAMIIAGFVQWVLMVIVLAAIGGFSIYLMSTLERGSQPSLLAKWFVPGAFGLLMGPVKLGVGIMFPSLCASMAMVGLANHGLPLAGETRRCGYVWRAAFGYAGFLIVVLPALALIITRQTVWLSHPSLGSFILAGSAFTGLIAGLAGGLTYWLVLRPDKQRAVLAARDGAADRLPPAAAPTG